MASETFHRGRELRARLLGKAHTDRVLATEDPIDLAVQELVTEFAYGAVWSRPDLPIQTRSLLTLVLLASQNRLDVLKQHVAGALNIGVPREQILEALIHILPYCGVPAMVGSVAAAKSVFRERDEAGQTKS
jgi:4-carboxymuconolactone decarboxylase